MRQWCHVSVMLALLAGHGSAAEPAPKKKAPVLPTKTAAKPFALEYRLMAHIARTTSPPPKGLEERADYLKRYGASGYSLRAVAAGPDAAADQRVLRQAAYLALTEAPLRAATALVNDFYKRQKIKIKPGRGAGDRSSRAHPIHAYIAGAEDEIQTLRDQIKGVQSMPYDPKLGPTGQAARLERVKALERQIELMQDLKKKLAAEADRVLHFEPLFKDIQRLAKKGGLEERTSTLESSAAERGKGLAGVEGVAVIGTQQVRIAFTEKRAQEIRRELAERFGNPKSTKDDVIFFPEPIDFLPQFWPSFRQANPMSGDYFITEYASGDGLVATLFEASGLWYPIVALEFEGKLHVRIPENPERSIYDKK